MFDRSDFAVFADPTLAGRLHLIQEVIDPKFEQAGPVLQAICDQAGLPKQTLHIAKHARRHKNPPPDTWLALSANPRGYKMLPHLELGLWPDRLFLWVAVLSETKPRTLPEAALDQVLALPAGFECSGDHTTPAAQSLTAETLAACTKRFLTTKSGEWLVGKTYPLADPLWADPEALWQDIQARTQALCTVYAAF